jgi:citrate synthase
VSDADNGWKTALTSIQPNEIRLRGYRLDELMGRVTFAQTVLLLLTGELPSPAAAELLDAMLVASVDHGATPPSTLAARTVASTGAPLGAAVAAGLLGINRYHGGAIEDCASLIRAALVEVARGGADVVEVARGVVADHQARRAVIPGLGHRFHTDDPRTARLFEMAEQRGIAGDGVRMLRAVQTQLAEQRGRALPINVDGAIAALLVDLAVPPGTANALFMIARLPGLVAHVVEETTRERPMRVVHPTGHSYDGPPPRELPSA